MLKEKKEYKDEKGVVEHKEKNWIWKQSNKKIQLEKAHGGW